MSTSICRFMPAKDYSGSIKTVNFVYETEFHKMKQPFFRVIYMLHIVTRGSAVFTFEGNRYELSKGSLFFAFPGFFYTIDATSDFEYVYISFMGNCVANIFEALGISNAIPVYNGFEHLIEFWFSSIRRLDNRCANILTESVLLYTLSYISSGEGGEFHNGDNIFDSIIDYIDRNYTDSDICLRKVAGIFSYTQKYLSSLFKKRMSIGFCTYINQLRIQQAISLMKDGADEIAMISERCGFSDPLYFSKVFRKKTGHSPSEYIKYLQNL